MPLPQLPSSLISSGSVVGRLVVVGLGAASILTAISPKRGPEVTLAASALIQCENMGYRTKPRTEATFSSILGGIAIVMLRSLQERSLTQILYSR